MGKKGPMATSSKFHQCKINPCKIGCKVWPNMATLVVVGKFVANIIIAFLCLFQYPFLSMNIPFSLCLSLTILLWLSLKYIICSFFSICLCHFATSVPPALGNCFKLVPALSKRIIIWKLLTCKNDRQITSGVFQQKLIKKVGEPSIPLFPFMLIFAFLVSWLIAKRSYDK